MTGVTREEGNVVGRGQDLLDYGMEVMVRAACVSISELLVRNREQRGGAQSRVVRDRGKRRVEGAREVVDEACGVAAAAPRVHNEGR